MSAHISITWKDYHALAAARGLLEVEVEGGPDGGPWQEDLDVLDNLGKKMFRALVLKKKQDKGKEVDS